MGRHEAVFTEGPGIAKLRRAADRAGELFRIGTAARIDHGDRAVVFALVVAWTETRHNFVGPRNGFRIDHRRAGVHVAVPGHLRGAVRVHGPEVSCSLLLEIARMFEPSGPQRCRTATCVSQQLTQRLHRLLTNTMSPSGKYVGSISSNGPSVSCFNCGVRNAECGIPSDWRLAIGPWFQISVSVSVRCCVPPHPGPLPGGEGELFPVAEETRAD